MQAPAHPMTLKAAEMAIGRGWLLFRGWLGFPAVHMLALALVFSLNAPARVTLGCSGLSDRALPNCRPQAVGRARIAASRDPGFVPLTSYMSERLIVVPVGLVDRSGTVSPANRQRAPSMLALGERIDLPVKLSGNKGGAKARIFIVVDTEHESNEVKSAQIFYNHTEMKIGTLVPSASSGCTPRQCASLIRINGRGALPSRERTDTNADALQV